MNHAASAELKFVKNDSRKLDNSESSEKLLALIETTLADEKGEEIVTIPLKGKSTIADYMVIASGRSNRQVASISEKLVDEIKHQGFGVARAEGKEQADWVLVDAGDVIVHIFRPEVREFYQIEKLWLTEQSTIS